MLTDISKWKWATLQRSFLKNLNYEMCTCKRNMYTEYIQTVWYTADWI